MSNNKKYCAIWTRVSTKRQEDEGGSLSDQNQKCEKYAKANGFIIDKHYGGTHESAKTPGKMIRDMIEGLKRTRYVTHLLVAHIDRFSRNAGQAFDMIEKLDNMDIIVVDVSNGIDSSTRNGKLMMQFGLSMAEWDNGNRTDKFQSGIRHCLESGIYCGGAKPLGYDKKGKSMGITFSINQDGRLLQRAFQWKLQGMSNVAIIKKLKQCGISVQMTKQKIHKILTNPFYAGKIRHKMLGDQIVDAKHPAIVSWADFQRVQDILSGKTGTYTHKKETPRFPLKRHVRCETDGTFMTGYTVKKKDIDYYKCNCYGCCTNVSARKMHSKYVSLLNRYEIPTQLKPLLRTIILDTITSTQQNQKEERAQLRKQRTEAEKMIKKIQMRFGVGDIDKEVYDTAVGEYQRRLYDIDANLESIEKELSNLGIDVDAVLAMCCKLGDLWLDAPLDLSTKLQNLLFPKGVFWSKQNNDYRTREVNEALLLIRRIAESCDKEKEENPHGNSSSVNLCASDISELVSEISTRLMWNECRC